VKCEKIFKKSKKEEIIMNRLELRTYELLEKIAKKESRRNGDSNEFKNIENAIIETKNAEMNYYFAKNVMGANKPEHEKVVLEYGDPYINYLYVSEVDSSNAEAHRKIIESSNDKSLIAKFIKETTPINEL